jgi:PAS domain S-box-containing protein
MRNGISKGPEHSLQDPNQVSATGDDEHPAYNRLFRDLTVVLGLLAVLTAMLGFLGMYFGITLISSVYAGYRTIALSAVLIWTIIGSVLVIHAAKPLSGTAALAARLVLAAIIIVEAIELPLEILGTHSLFELWLTEAGRTIISPSSAPMSPVATIFIILAALSLFFLLQDPGGIRKGSRVADAAGITGLVISVASFTFVISYVFGDPLLYGTQYIPIAAMSALAAFFIGAGLVTIAGPAAVPLAFITGNSTRARLLRHFVPLVVAIILIQQVLFSTLFAHNIDDAILVAVSLVLFALVTGYVVSRMSGSLGSALDRAEKELVQKNEDLGAMNEELGAMNEELVSIEEELRQNIDELGKSQEALRESEGRLSLAQQAAGAGVWDWNVVTGAIIWSPYLYKIFGIDPEKNPASFDIWTSILHPDDREGASMRIRQALDQHGTLDSEYRIVRPDGDVRWINALGQGSYGDNGRPVRMSGICIDITDRKNIEHDHSVLETRYRRLYETAKDGVLLLDADSGKIFDANPFILDLLGYQLNDLVGRELWEIGFIQDATLARDAYRELRDKGYIRYEDLPVKTKDGRSIDVEFVSNSYMVDHTRVIQCNIRDITARKKAEEALRESEMQLRRAQDLLDSITKSTGIMIAAEDTEFRFTYFNKAYAEEIKKITGRDLAIGMSMVDLFAHLPGEQENSRKQWKKVLGGKSIKQTVSFKNPGSEPRTFNVLHTPIRDNDGRVIGAGEVSYDVTRQIQTEDELRKTSQYLENLITYANAPIIVWDPEFRITRFNRAFERLTGRTAQEVIGQTPDILIPEKYRSRAMELIKGTTRGKRWEVVEIPILHKDGEIRTVLWNSAVLTNDNCKTIIATIAQGQDITDRKHAEEALQLLETRERAQIEELTKVLDAVPAAVWISHDPQGLHITGNRLSHEWLNLYEGANMSKSAPPGERPETFLMFRNGRELRPEEMPVQLSSSGKEVRNYEFDFVYPNGKMRHVLGNATPLIDESGNPRGSVSAFIDITDRRLAEETVISEKKKAEETLSLLNAALESTADGIFVVNTARKITSFNQNFISLWNIRDAALMAGDDRMVLEIIKQQVKDPDTFLERVLDLYRFPERERFDMVELNDGRIFERHSKPQKLKDEIIGRVWSYRDVTDRRRAEEKLLQSLKEKETLIREIHHRVKNNLQIISGLLDMTRMRTPDSTTTAILTDMMMKIKTMAQIHTRLYESKQFDKINMGSQIRDQVTDMTSIYGRSGTEIQSEIDVQDVYLPVDQAIPCALVVNEILSNAFKHAFRGRKQGNIRVSVTREADFVRIIVKDDGIGIPRDVDVYKTTSLGLKLIRSLVLQLSGSVNIESNHGTEVTVECPFNPGGK